MGAKHPSEMKENETFSDKQKLREFITLQEMMKEVLQAKMKGC